MTKMNDAFLFTKSFLILCTLTKSSILSGPSILVTWTFWVIYLKLSFQSLVNENRSDLGCNQSNSRRLDYWLKDEINGSTLSMNPLLEIIGWFRLCKSSHNEVFLNNSVFKMKTEEIILNKEKKGNRVSQSLGRVATILISFKFWVFSSNHFINR